jgi:hypothetical protein
MKVKTLTLGKLRKVCQEHKYLIVREKGGFTMAVNTGIANLRASKQLPDSAKSNYISYFPCDFQEYISNKVPFIR